MYKFRQNQLVTFDIPNGKESVIGEGIVVGVASMGAPVIGVTYIIKPTKFADNSVVIPNEAYPFECMALQEIFLTPVPAYK